ncbi:MAG: diacylglycerol kinase [Bacilli bacterium]|nr:diacylglycerol kinase [Bacilli bacterium]
MKKKNFIISIVIILILFLLLVSCYQYDVAISDYLKSISSDGLDFAMQMITYFGNIICLLIITLFLIIALDYRTSKNIVEVILTGLLTNTLIKLIFRRPRPLSIFYEQGYSFPSGHMMLSVMFYGYLCYLVYHSKCRKSLKIAFYITMTLLVGAIGLSRVYLNVHYLTDVIGGILFGYLMMLLFIIYTKQKHKLIDESIRLDRSFKYAFKGIGTVVLYEKNMHIHVLATICVLILGLKFEITKFEWLACLIVIGMVISSEIFNTAIEKCVDYISLEKNKLAASIKDMAAGAVLINAIIALIVGIIIFLPKIILYLK